MTTSNGAPLEPFRNASVSIYFYCEFLIKYSIFLWYFQFFDLFLLFLSLSSFLWMKIPISIDFDILLGWLTSAQSHSEDMKLLTFNQAEFD